jgi:chromosome segregation ATPase
MSDPSVQTNSDLERISQSATDTVTTLHNHSWGVPLIPKAYSVLSAHEQEILLLNEELTQLKFELAGIFDKDNSGLEQDQSSDEKLEDLLGRLKTHDLVLNRVLTAKELAESADTNWDGRLARLDAARAELDIQVMKRSNTVRQLTKEINGIEEENTVLHECNRAMVQEIKSLLTENKIIQESKFTAEEHAEYESVKQTLLQTRAKADVICELILSLISATGVNWAKDPRLKQLVERCGTHLLEDADLLFEQ